MEKNMKRKVCVCYIYIYKLNHFDVYWKLTQHCRSSIIQFKKIYLPSTLKWVYWSLTKKTTFTQTSLDTSFP